LGPRGLLVGPDPGAIANVENPGAPAWGRRLVREGLSHALAKTRLLPTGEAAGDGLPGARALREVPPRSPGAQKPYDAVHHGAMVMGWAPTRGVVGGSKGCRRSHGWFVTSPRRPILRQIQSGADFANRP
jgi:hypothetical protein